MAPGLAKCDLLSEVVLYLVRVAGALLLAVDWFLSVSKHHDRYFS